MRLLYNIFIIAFMVFVFMVVIMIVSYGVDTLHSNVKSTLENMTNETGENVSIDNVDVYEKTPGVDLLNYLLIIALIIAIIGVFMYSEKR